MSLLQQACDTYDNAEEVHAGVYDAGKNEPLPGAKEFLDELRKITQVCMMLEKMSL